MRATSSAWSVRRTELLSRSHKPVQCCAFSITADAQRRYSSATKACLTLRHLTAETRRPFSVFQGARPLAPALHVPTGTGVSSGAARQVVQQSFFGVGAPEAVLVGVVALVVFGPKGLAEAAKSVGRTLRAFQPTIREAVEVSRDLRGTLEKELGLDEMRDISRPAARLRNFDEPIASSSNTIDPDIETKRAQSAAAAWGDAATSSIGNNTSGGSMDQNVGSSAKNRGNNGPTSGTGTSATVSKDLASLSLSELEAELARRRNAATSSGSGQDSA